MPHRKQVDNPLANTGTITAPGGLGRLGLSRGGGDRGLVKAAGRDAAMLANALERINPQVSGTLRSIAAKKEQEALTLGEQIAIASQSKGSMFNINEELKKRVENKELRRGRLPDAIIGYKIGRGKILAQNTLAPMLSRLSETSQVEGRVDPSDVISDIYNAQLNEVGDDPRARLAFDNEFARQADDFRRRSDLAFVKNSEIAQDQVRNDLVTGHLDTMSAASNTQEEHTGTTQLLHLFQTEFVQTLPRELVVEKWLRAVDVSIRKLAADGEHEKAQELKDEAYGISFGPKGATVGSTAFGTQIGTQLDGIIQSSKRDRNRDLQIANTSAELSARRFTDAFVVERQGVITQADADQAFAEYAAQNPNDDTGQRTVLNIMDDEVKGTAQRDDPRMVAKVGELTRIFEFDEGQSVLDAATMSAGTRLHLQEELDKAKGLAGIWDPNFLKAWSTDLFRGSAGLIQGDIEFKSFDEGVAFALLDGTTQGRIELEALQFGKEFFTAKVLQDGGNFEEAKANRGIIAQEALEAARRYTNQLTVEATSDKRRKEVERIQVDNPIQTQTTQINFRTMADTMELNTNALSGILVQAAPTTSADASVAALGNIEALKKHLAKNSNGDVSPQYRAIKAITGFKSSEVIAEKTEEGIEIDASQMPWRSHSVFDDLGALEVAYNRGHFEDDGLFAEVANKVTGGVNVDPEDFYLVQRAILRAKPKAIAEINKRIQDALNKNK